MHNVCVSTLDIRTQIVATKDAAIQLVHYLFSVLTGKMDFQVEILKLSISVLLRSLCQVQNLISKKEVEADVITAAFGRCQSALQEWVKHPNVIGGSMFGGRVDQYQNRLLHGSAELKVYYNYSVPLFYLWIQCYSVKKPFCK